MRILPVSDLHIEFPGQQRPELPPEDTYDIIVAAGDIGIGADGVRWLAQTFPTKPVLFIEGNHEYYGAPFGQRRREIIDECNQHSNIVHLDGQAITLDGVRFVGATLWTDFKLKGYMDLPLMRYESSIADFKWGLTAEDELAMFNHDVAFLDGALEGDNSRTVVVTHFVPSQLCIHEKWLGSPFNPYFTNDLDWLMEKHKYPLHIFGHTHDPHDVIHPSGTRLFCNPGGYPNERGDYGFKIIEI